MKLIQRLTTWLKRITVKVYIFNITLIVFSLVMFVSVFIYANQPPWKGEAYFALPTASNHWGQPQIMHEIVMRIQDKLEARVTFYDHKNGLVLTGTEPPLPPLTSKELKRLEKEGSYIRHKPPPVAAVSVVRDGKIVGYGLFSPELPGRFWIMLISLSILLVIIGVFSFIFSRSLVQPINRLSETANAFGQGDFTVKTGLRRDDEIGFLAEAFDEMAGRVESLLRSQKELIANVSHELRTPLSRIKVALYLAAESDEGLSGEQWNDIVHDLDDLEELINDILMAARLDLDSGNKKSSEIPLHFKEVDTKSLLEKITASFNNTCTTHKAELYIDGPLSPMWGDQKLLRRLINNLLDNARKYSEPHTPITIKAYDEDSTLRMEIIDGGIGIDEENLETIFKPFFRTDQGRTRSSAGVGLGLTLARRIIEAHGGTIHLTSTVGKETMVHLRIPRNATSRQNNAILS